MSTTRSRKNKGKRLQNLVTLKFRELFKGILTDGDIQSQIMGVNGTDVVLSPSAKNLIPYDIECKNNESLVSAVMKDAIEQAETNTQQDRIPLLIFKSNNEPERVILRLDDFLELIYPNQDVTVNSDKKQQILIKLEQLKHLLVTEVNKSS